jgi:hypothetical protein
MTEIILLGRDTGSSPLKRIMKSPAYKITRTKNADDTQAAIDEINPDFVLCSGRIELTEHGKYVLVIN